MLAHAIKGYIDPRHEKTSPTTRQFYDFVQYPLKTKAMEAWCKALLDAYKKAGGIYPESCAACTGQAILERTAGAMLSASDDFEDGIKPTSDNRPPLGGPTPVERAHLSIQVICSDDWTQHVRVKAAFSWRTHSRPS